MHDDRQSASLEQLSKSVVDAAPSATEIDPPVLVAPPATRAPPLPAAPPRDIVPPASAPAVPRLVRAQPRRENMTEQTRKKSG
jgi:hypothetical protein